MRVGVVSKLRMSKKVPLARLLRDMVEAFEVAGAGRPDIQFTLADSGWDETPRIVSRAIKAFPDLGAYATNVPMLLGLHGEVPALIGQVSRDGGDGIDLPLLEDLLSGVPRRFPLGSIKIEFRSLVFGRPITTDFGMSLTPAVTVEDERDFNGRRRSAYALTIVEVEAIGKKKPVLPDAVEQILTVCGKRGKTEWMPLTAEGECAAEEGASKQVPTTSLEAQKAIGEIVASYRADMASVATRARMPHALPPLMEALSKRVVAEATGPKKPVLDAVFKPLGYRCKGSASVYRLTRLTSKCLKVELELDVGTWSHLLTTTYNVVGAGFNARLFLPVSPVQVGAMQYPIGDAARWRMIVENLGALVAHLDDTFALEIDAQVEPLPDWYHASA